VHLQRLSMDLARKQTRFIFWTAPNSNELARYDWRYQAATLEEAVANFVDPTAADPSRALTMYGARPSVLVRQKCLSIECLSCYDVLAQRLKPFVGLPELTLLSGVDRSSLQTCKILGTGNTPGQIRLC